MTDRRPFWEKKEILREDEGERRKEIVVKKSVERSATREAFNIISSPFSIHLSPPDEKSNKGERFIFYFLFSLVKLFDILSFETLFLYFSLEGFRIPTPERNFFVFFSFFLWHLPSARLRFHIPLP